MRFRLYCCIQRMNSNGCVQAWVDIKCIEASLKPYMNTTSAGFIGNVHVIRFYIKLNLNEFQLKQESLS